MVEFVSFSFGVGLCAGLIWCWVLRVCLISVVWLLVWFGFCFCLVVLLCLFAVCFDLLCCLVVLFVGY